MTQVAHPAGIETPCVTDYAELLQVWEASVRASHHFLLEEDIQVFKSLISNKYFHLVRLFCIRVEGRVAGFLGTSDDKIEMLFVHPHYQGQKIGKQLLLHAIGTLKMLMVDVNEQNENAVKFYTHFGFQVISRSHLDGMGKPYLILHLKFP